MAKLWCFSYKNFKKFLTENNYTDNTLPTNIAVISICSTSQLIDVTKHELKTSDRVLNLDFDDITEYNKSEYNIYGLSDEQGEEILNFIEKHKGKDIYVHCSAGMSRSQAVVKFILETFYDYYDISDTNPDNPCLYPNMHVVDVLRKVYKNRYNLLYYVPYNN